MPATVIGRLHLERYIEPFVFETTLRGVPVDPSGGLSWADRFEIGREEVRAILRKIWPYLLVGIGVGAVIDGWVPEGFFLEHAGPDDRWPHRWRWCSVSRRIRTPPGSSRWVTEGDIVSRGVTSTPALVVDGRAVIAGRVHPSPNTEPSSRARFRRY